jgi:hypothetical protein
MRTLMSSLRCLNKRLRTQNEEVSLLYKVGLQQGINVHRRVLFGDLALFLRLNFNPCIYNTMSY